MLMMTIVKWRPRQLLDETVRFVRSRRRRHDAFELFDAGLMPFEGLDGHLMQDIGIGPNGYHAHVGDLPADTRQLRPD
jgi:hypothetical protein